MRNLKDIDLIGKKIFLENSSDPSKLKKKGIVIFETKNVIVLRDENNKLKKIKKNEILKIKEIL